jgi:hypothetical protein
MGDPNAFAMPAGVRNMPTAMHSPATRAVAEARPRSRRSSGLGIGGVTVTVVMFGLEGRLLLAGARIARAPNAFELYLNGGRSAVVFSKYCQLP